MGAYLTHLVQKGYEDDGVQRFAGECVNAMHYRTLHSMVSQRYIAPLPEGVDPIPDTEGRFWISDAAMKIAKREPLEAAVEVLPDIVPPGTNFALPVKDTKYRPNDPRNRWQMFDQTVFVGREADALAEHETMKNAASSAAN